MRKNATPWERFCYSCSIHKPLSAFSMSPLKSRQRPMCNTCRVQVVESIARSGEKRATLYEQRAKEYKGGDVPPFAKK